MAHGSHHRGDLAGVRCAVLTVSDTRTPDDDASGARVRALLTAAEHRVTAYAIVPDEPHRIVAAVAAMRAQADAIICNGGTGIAPRDTTYQALRGLIDQEIPGFGELFRMLSYDQVGAAAMLSRAIGGVSRGCVLFALPGSTKAVELAMTKLIVPQLGHLVGLLRGG